MAASDLLTDEEKRAFSIVLLHEGPDADGQWCYLYISVRGDKLEEYWRIMNLPEGPTEEQVLACGEVLASGLGEPTEEVKRRMENEYNFNHATMVVVPPKAE